MANEPVTGSHLIAGVGPTVDANGQLVPMRLVVTDQYGTPVRLVVELLDRALRDLGTVTVDGVVSIDPLTTVKVTQDTAANLKVDLSGTAANATALKVDGSAVNQPVTGAGAAGASVAGNPVRLGGLGKTVLPTAVTSAQLVDLLLDRYGRTYVVAPVVTTATSNGTPITTNTNTQIVGAPSAGNHLRIHRLWAQNSSATGTWCYWGNGSGVKTIPFYLAQYQPFSMAVNGEWELSTATGLFMNTATTAANIEWFVAYETLTD